jgi:hypothetical protein
VYIVAYLRGEDFEVAQQGKVRGSAELGTHGERHIDGTGDEGDVVQDNSSHRGSLFGLEKIVRERSFHGRSLLGCRAVLTDDPSFELAGTCALLAHRVHCIPFTPGTLLLSSQMYRMLQNGRRWWNRPRRDVTLSIIAIRGRSLSCGC